MHVEVKADQRLLPEGLESEFLRDGRSDQADSCAGFEEEPTDLLAVEERLDEQVTALAPSDLERRGDVRIEGGVPSGGGRV